MLNKLGIFLSLVSFIWLAMTVNVTLHQIGQIDSEIEAIKSLTIICESFGWSILGISFLFVLQSFLSTEKINKQTELIGSLPIENKSLKKRINLQILKHRVTVECLHDIHHYYRYIAIQLRDACTALQDPASSDDDLILTVNTVTGNFEKFISTLLTNLTVTVSALTRDQCSTCIKIIKENKVKTLYRDPISYRSRRPSNFTPKGKVFIYTTEDNSAFDHIADPNVKETFFFCDDLSGTTGKNSYRNRNDSWRSLYNATAVVPVQANLSGNERKNEMRLLGFLCCDNMKGGFENKEMKDLMSSIGDSLYNLLDLFDKFSTLTSDKGIKNDFIKEYKYWGDS